jgi:hypothetical protein
MLFRRGGIPVARAYLEAHAPQHQTHILDLLDIWATEMDHPEMKREAEPCASDSGPWQPEEHGSDGR